MSSSVIRKITRGTSTVNNANKTISCSITDTSKVIVLLDVDACYTYDIANSGDEIEASGGSAGVYLVSVSTTGIVVKGSGFYASDYILSNNSITFSYQIIEFM